MTLQIRALGKFQIECDGAELTAHFEPTRIFLITYLVDANRPLTRAHLAELLWPDRPPGRARSNLRTLLTRLRPLLAQQLQVDNTWLTLQPDQDDWFDVHAFTAARKRAEALSAQDPGRMDALLAAAALYHGDFLAEINPVENEALESWLMTRRLQLHGQAVQVIRELLAHPDCPSDIRIELARQLLQMEPLDEQACRTIMQLLAEQNQRDEALWHFQRYQRELTDVWSAATPSEELVMMAAKIRLGMDLQTATTTPKGGRESVRPTERAREQRQEAAHPQSSSESARATHTESVVDRQDANPPLSAFRPFSLPVKPLIGRQEERERFVQWLDLGYRLISITGLGGVGKSHFTQTVLAAETKRWRSGGLYITISEGSTDVETQSSGTRQDEQRRAVLALSRAIAAALDLPLQSGPDSTEQLVQTLASCDGCLVLDNFELLLPAAPFLQTMLAKAGKLTVVAISRRRLLLAAEANIPLDGLPSRLSTGDQNALALTSGMGTAEELLTLNFARHQPNFQLKPTDREQLHRICQAVRGLPLALEMIPALTRRMTLSEVAALLKTDPLTLTAEYADANEQQRSLYALMDSTFAATTPSMQKTLMRLTVFSTPFTAESAQSVLNSREWVELKEQRWLDTVDEIRFTLHPLIAAFLRSLRTEQHWAAIYANARRAHAAFYAEQLVGQAFLQNPHHTATIIWLNQNFVEVTNACQTLLEESPTDAVDLLHLITIYGQYFGDLSTVRLWLERGLAALPQTHPVRFRLLLDYLTCISYQYDSTAIELAVAEAHALIHTQDDQITLLELYIRLGWIAHRDSTVTTPALRQEGWRYFSQALVLAEAMEDQQQIADILAQRAFLASWDPTKYEQAQADCRRALAMAHQLGQPSLLATIYKFYAYLEFAAGHFPLAQRFNERAGQLLSTEAGPALIRGWLCTERSQMALAQRELAVAKQFLQQAESIFHPANYEVGLIQCSVLQGIVALFEDNMALAERHWLLGYRIAYNLTQMDKLVVPLILGIGVTQLVQGDPLLGAQLVAVARARYKEKSFHWVPPEQQPMNYMLERAETEMAALTLPPMPIDEQMAMQALRLMADIL